ncbi:MAG: NAD(P)/FAD-dependent oxidoreductase [Bacteroidaceae bacterium]|nr:NAD(P)/FAD-dependent oxidoreductase [Bacteroidaceae bacterium]
MRTAIIGGGAAGFFVAINLKELCPQMEVTIFERSHHLLRKVKVSGGGRCNCTNTFAAIRDLSEAYPRGHRLMKRLMKGFSERDAYAWFESHGVPLTVQPDGCVFPAAQDSQAIIDCFLRHAQRLGIDIRTDSAVASLNFNDNLNPNDNLNSFIVLTTGGQPSMSGLRWLADLGHEIVPPVPSLFTFSIEDERLRGLMGTVVDHTESAPAALNVTAFIPGTKFRAEGALLITHWGMSGPAILKLSSYAARYLADNAYRAPLAINWTGLNEDEVRQHLAALFAQYPSRLLANLHPFGLPSRLWTYLLDKASIEGTAAALSKKYFNRLVTLLTADTYAIASRAPFKDEFVTCGGVALTAVNPSTLESRHCPHLFFAGELLDIDGITGGFNFQAAWTTAYTVARAIAATAS